MFLIFLDCIPDKMHFFFLQVYHWRSLMYYKQYRAAGEKVIQIIQEWTRLDLKITLEWKWVRKYVVQIFLKFTK